MTQSYNTPHTCDFTACKKNKHLESIVKMRATIITVMIFVFFLSSRMILGAFSFAEAALLGVEDKSVHNRTVGSQQFAHRRTANEGNVLLQIIRMQRNGSVLTENDPAFTLVIVLVFGFLHGFLIEALKTTGRLHVAEAGKEAHFDKEFLSRGLVQQLIFHLLGIPDNICSWGRRDRNAAVRVAVVFVRHLLLWRQRAIVAS